MADGRLEKARGGLRVYEGVRVVRGLQASYLSRCWFNEEEREWLGMNLYTDSACGNIQKCGQNNETISQITQCSPCTGSKQLHGLMNTSLHSAVSHKCWFSYCQKSTL